MPGVARGKLRTLATARPALNSVPKNTSGCCDLLHSLGWDGERCTVSWCFQLDGAVERRGIVSMTQFSAELADPDDSQCVLDGSAVPQSPSSRPRAFLAPDPPSCFVRFSWCCRGVALFGPGQVGDST